MTTIDHPPAEELTHLADTTSTAEQDATTPDPETTDPAAPRDELADALATAAGRAPELTRQLQHLRAEVKRLQRAAGETPRDLRADLARTILDTGEVPTDLGARLVYVNQASSQAYEAALFLQGLENTIKADIEREHVAGSDAALKHLDARTQEILDRARQLVPLLDGARTPAEVLDAGPVAADAWRHLADLARAYAAVRQAQEVITAEAWRTVDQQSPHYRALYRAGIIRDVAALWPDWVDEGRGYGARPPWPHQDPQNPYLVQHDRDFLLWAVDAQAQLWVPTVDQLHQADAALDAARYAATMNRRGGDTPPRRILGADDDLTVTVTH